MKQAPNWGSQNKKPSLKIFFILTSKVGIMIDPSGSIAFYGVISVWQDSWIWKKTMWNGMFIIKRKSVTALEHSESFNSDCWTQVHIYSQSLSLREYQL